MGDKKIRHLLLLQRFEVIAAPADVAMWTAELMKLDLVVEVSVEMMLTLKMTMMMMMLLLLLLLLL